MKNCHLCGKSNSRELCRVNNLIVMRCDSCSIDFVDETMSPQEIKNLYEVDDYYQKHFSFYSPGIEDKIMGDYLEDVTHLERKWISQGKVLDFGCSDGTFLSKLSNSWDKYGVDISEQTLAKAKQKMNPEHFFCGDVLELELPKDFFDLITLWMVIEHLQNPLDIMSKLSKSVKQGGFVILRTPNRDSLLTAIASFLHSFSFGKISKPLSLFYSRLHLYYFDLKSLTLLLEKSGFKVVGIRYDQRYVTKHSLSLFPIFKRIPLKILTIASQILNMQDSISVFARKL